MKRLAHVSETELITAYCCVGYRKQVREVTA